MSNNRPTRVNPLVVFLLTLTLVLGFIVILIGAWDVPTPVCEVRIELPHDALIGLEPSAPTTALQPECR